MSNYLMLLSTADANNSLEDCFNAATLVVQQNEYSSVGVTNLKSKAFKNTGLSSYAIKIAFVRSFYDNSTVLPYIFVTADTRDELVNEYGVNHTVAALSRKIDSGGIQYRGEYVYVSTLQAVQDHPTIYQANFSSLNEAYENPGIPIIEHNGQFETPRAFRAYVASLMDDGFWENRPTTDPDYGDTSGPEGYGDTGDHDHTSDTISIPDEPSLGVTTAGFIRAYNPTQSQLNDLGVVLFPPSPTQATDAVEAILAVAAGLYNSKLIDYVVDVHVIPVTPQVGSAENIFCGNVNTYVASNRVTSDYVDFSCGSLNVGECYGNYIDYMTRGRLFLPFVGFVDLKPEYWQSGTLTVDYRFNIVDGSFMAFVRSTSSKSQLSNTVIGQYGGNCCTHFPLTGLNYSSMLSGLITGSMQLAAAVGAGSPVGVATSAATMLNQKPSVSQSNNYNASTSFLGVRRPYLLLERPVPNFAAYYNHERGLPLNVTYQLSDLSGFTTIPEIDLSSLSCTEKEKAELSRLFAEGVYF